jgi:MFS family permease
MVERPADVHYLQSTKVWFEAAAMSVLGATIKSRDRYWQRVVALGFAGWVIMYADRSILSPALPAIQQQWDVSASILGLIVSSFFVAYALVQIPVGILSDRLQRRMLLLVPGFVVIALGVLLSGSASRPAYLLLASVVMGIGQGVYYPIQFSLSTESIPKSRRAFATSIINSGQAVGITFGLLLAGFIVPLWDGAWRVPFWIMAIPTLLVGLAFAVGIRPDRQNVGNTNSDGSGCDATQPVTGNVWSYRTVCLCVINFCSNFGFFIILTWLPFYLEVDRGFGTASVGWIASLVPWAAVVGGLVMSWISDHARHRKYVALATLPLCALSLIAIPFDSTLVLFAALLIYGLVGKLALDPVLIAMVADGIPSSCYGKVFGVFNFSAMLASISGPYLMGWLSASAVGMNAGFYIASVLIGIAAILVMSLPSEVNGAR